MLGDLISVLLAPYDDTGAFSGRIRVAVPRIGVGEQSATTFALIIQELATNSLKYGALSVASGMLNISGTNYDQEVQMTWTERGGPTVEHPGNDVGYGSKLLNRSVSVQLGGTIFTDWSVEGIVVTLKMNAQKLSL